MAAWSTACWGELPHGQTLLYKVSPQGGAPAQLPLANAAFNSFSADGQWLAFCPWTREYDTWNRYMGGTATRHLALQPADA